MTLRSVITVVRDGLVFNSLLIALSYVPAVGVGCTVAYYWLWFAGSKESVARLIWLLVLMLLLSVVTFTFGEFNNLLDISQFDITELKFELFFLLLPLFAYAMFLLLRDERISREKTVRDLTLRKLADEGDTIDQASQTLIEVVRELKAIREQLSERVGKPCSL